MSTVQETTDQVNVRKEPSPAEKQQFLIASKYPTKKNKIRKIVPLWGNYFRVNYFNIEKQNCIDESYFIEVNLKENKLTEI